MSERYVCVMEFVSADMWRVSEDVLYMCRASEDM